MIIIFHRLSGFKFIATVAVYAKWPGMVSDPAFPPPGSSDVQKKIAFPS